MKRGIFCSYNCYRPLKDTHTGKCSAKLKVSYCFPWFKATRPGVFCSLKGEETVTHAMLRHLQFCSTDRKPNLSPQEDLQECLLLGRNNKYSVSHSVPVCLLPGLEGTRKCRGCHEKHSQGMKNHSKCCCLNEKPCASSGSFQETLSFCFKE